MGNIKWCSLQQSYGWKEVIGESVVQKKGESKTMNNKEPSQRKPKMLVDEDYLADLERQVEVLREKNTNQRKVLEFYSSSFTPVKGTFGLEWQPKESLLDDCGNMATEILTAP